MPDQSVRNMTRRARSRRVVCVFAAAVWIATGAAFAAEAEVAKNKLVFVTVSDRLSYEMTEPQGRFSGYDVDVGKALARYLGKPFELFVYSEKEMLQAVSAAKADAVIGLEPLKKYERIFDFSTPVLINKIRLFVREDAGSIHALRDLKGRRVGINRQSDIRDLLRLLPGIQIVVEPDTAVGLDDLAGGKISVYLGDEHETLYYIRANRLSNVRSVGGALILRRRCIAVRKGNANLLEEINGAIDRMKKDYVLQSIHETYFGTGGTGRLPRRFLAMILGVLGFIAVVLLVSLLWNQKLADAVFARTQELEAERAHFRNIFDHASDGIVIIDPATTAVLEANKALEDIVGFTREELAAFEMKNLEIPEDRTLENEIRRALASGENTLFEARLRNKAGGLVDLLIHARPFPYKGRTVVEAIVRDVTERKKIQEMKDTILQDVAHELKTPMSKMGMSLDLLERNIAKDGMKEYEKFFDICRRSVTRLQGTIDGILNLSRLESRTMKMEHDVFLVQDVLLNVIDELGMLAQKKGVTLAHHLASEPLLLKADMEMCRRLFVNIIHNAIKFTPRGRVTISARRDKQDTALISVKDDGIGLEPADLKKIFSRFYQKTPAHEGCGIGLTISQKIVALHNGTMWAESEGIGKGTTMHVLFPLHTAGVAHA